MIHKFTLGTSRKGAGFTLIEVMITVAIIGILAAIAIPTYDSYIRRGKAQEAMSDLATMRVKMEQYYQDNRSYLNYVDANCGRAGAAILSSKYFTYACATEDDKPNEYLITATGAANQGMGGYIYTINQNNVKTSTIPPNASVNCWVSKSGEPC